VKILVVAGEASADLHAGHLVEKLKKSIPVDLVGIGGDRLVQEGLCPVIHARDMAVVGFSEAIKKIPQTIRLLSELEKLAEKEKPDFALLLDLPDFNLRLAPRLKRLGIPVVYYISPQVWAWRSGRVYQMANCLDLLLSILPFEKEWYRQNAPSRLRVEYVGHPALEEIPDLPYEPELRQIAILPGSRESEWQNLFGPMIMAAALLSKSHPTLEFYLPLAETLRQPNSFARECLSLSGPFGEAIRSLGEKLHVVEVPAHEVLRRSKSAWIASGTATLEAAIVGTPMVVAYKVSNTTAFIFKHLVRYQGAVGMVNLIHGGLNSTERAVVEVLQNEVTPENLATRMRELLTEPGLSAQRTRLARTRSLLSGSGMPVQNAANAILKFVGTHT